MGEETRRFRESGAEHVMRPLRETGRCVDAETRFRELFASAYPALRRYAHHRGLNGPDADDLVAEVLTIAWRRLDALPTDDPIPWLFAVARNVRRNDLRKGARLRRLSERLRNTRELTTPAYEPADVEAADIRAALAALRDDDRELLLLIGWDGLTPTQAASTLRCSPNTLRVRLHRARDRLAAQLSGSCNGRARDDSTQYRSTTEEVHDGS